LLLFALYWLVELYIRLYRAYTPFGKDISFGNMESNKETLFRYLIISTVSMWIFYTIQCTKHMYQNYLTKYRVFNSVILLIAALSIINSVYAFTLSQSMNKTMHTIVVPPPIK
jgi:hypothetical protein